MNVAVGEAWEKEAALRVNHFCRDAAQRLDLFTFSDGDDLDATNGDRLCALLLRIDGVDAGVRDDYVGGLRGRIRRHQRRNREQNGKQGCEQECDAETRLGKAHNFDSLWCSECRRSVDPQQPGLATAGIFSVVRCGALKIKTVAALEMVLLAVKSDFQFAAQDEEELLSFVAVGLATAGLGRDAKQRGFHGFV